MRKQTRIGHYVLDFFHRLDVRKLQHFEVGSSSVIQIWGTLNQGTLQIFLPSFYLMTEEKKNFRRIIL
jgi:hypothetical protein